MFGFLKNIGRSADLSARMGRAVGYDATAALTANPETEARQIARRIYRCAACGQQEQCVKLLATAKFLGEAPAYCPNKAAFDHAAA